MAPHPPPACTNQNSYPLREALEARRRPALSLWCGEADANVRPGAVLLALQHSAALPCSASAQPRRTCAHHQRRPPPAAAPEGPRRRQGPAWRSQRESIARVSVSRPAPEGAWAAGSSSPPNPSPGAPRAAPAHGAPIPSGPHQSNRRWPLTCWPAPGGQARWEAGRSPSPSLHTCAGSCDGVGRRTAARW